MSRPGMMNYGAASRTSETRLVLLHTRTCALLARPCIETAWGSKGPAGLWIREPYRGFKTVLFILLRKVVEIIPPTLPWKHKTLLLFIISSMKVCRLYNIIHTLTKSVLCVIVDTSEYRICAQFCTKYSIN